MTNHYRRLGNVFLHLGCAFSLSTVAALPLQAAEKVSFYVGPLEFSLSVDSLEEYARDGNIRPDLRTYTNRLTEIQRAQLRQILETRAEVTPVAIAQFLYSPQGEVILREFGELIQTRSGQSGFYAIRSALILAAADPQGLTPLNVLRKFPTSDIRINSDRVFELLGRVTRIVGETERAIAAIGTNALASTATVEPATFPLNLRDPGTVQSIRESFTLRDRSRDRTFPVDLYLPQQSGVAPLVVISHGLGSNRESFEYLALHLVSHGFAVAVPEHPGSSADQLEALASGLTSDITPARELVDRPLDIQFLLDELQRRYAQQIDVQNVGVVGQSFGGYTALALAGAKINFEELQANCDPDDPDFNISFLLQCQALELPPQDYNLRDERVGSAIAINPLTSSIFGDEQLSQIQIPVAIVSGSADAVTPALDEQILPFTSLTTSNRYLLLLVGGTHFSTIGPTSQDADLPPQVIGPDPAIAYDYMKAFNLAFFKTYIANDSQYQPYLSATYAQTLSRQEMPLNFIESLTREQLNLE
ncbi:MAG: alpha/beta hydrolase [Cyanobacteriota bacterium]|nr:alpha/beta hydrolase [Cyanobacteriota bacterium]